MFDTLRITERSNLLSLLQDPAFSRGRNLLVIWEALPAEAQGQRWAQALTRQARRTGQNLAFACLAPAPLSQLRQASLPAFASVESATRYLRGQSRPPPQARAARAPRGGPTAFASRPRPQAAAFRPTHASLPRQPTWRRAAAVLLGLLLAAGALLAFARFVRPAATITVYPPTERLVVNVPMTASLLVEETDPDAGLAPARYVAVRHEIVGTRAASGRRLRPAAKAQGFLLASNNADEAVTVPAGTYVQTGTGQAIRFATTEAVVLAARTPLVNLIPIAAVEPGEAGNVPANSINTIAGGLAFRLRVTNPEPTGGGQSTLTSVVSQTDKEELRAHLLANARQQARQILAHEVIPQEWLPDASIDVSVQWTTTDFFNEEATDEFTMTMMVLVSGLAVDTRTLVAPVLAQIGRHTPPDGRLLPATLDIALQPDPDVAGAEIRFDVTAAAEYVRTADAERIRAQIAGKSLPEAAALLAAWSPRAEPQIQLQPGHQDALPRLAQRIQVRTELPGAPAAGTG